MKTHKANSTRNEGISMKKALQYAGIVVMTLISLAAEASLPQWRNARVIWHGHNNVTENYARGWWQSGTNWFTGQYWWNYAPSASGTVQFLTVDKRYRYLLGFLQFAEGYTYRANLSPAVPVGAGDAMKQVAYLNAEEGGFWFENTDFWYVYAAERGPTIMRVVLGSPMDNTVPPSNPLPGPALGPALFEVQVLQAGTGFIQHTFFFTVPSGITTVDFRIDHAAGTATIENQWSGAAEFSLGHYFEVIYPHDPQWTSLLD